MDTMEYNIVEDMKKTRESISLHELKKLKQQQKMLLRELNVVHVSPLLAVVVSQVAKCMVKPSTSSNKFDPIDVILSGDISNSHTPPLILMKIFILV
jgi:hypothetical protein